MKRWLEKLKPLSVGIGVITVIIFWANFLIPDSYSQTNNVKCPDSSTIAVLQIRGVIVEDDGQYDFIASPAERIVKRLKEIGDTPSIKALVLDIDSTGGSMVAADEIVGELKSIPDKAKVAIIRNNGDSAAYYIASAADKIYANAFSDIGAIGITMSFTETDDSGIYQALSSGKYKDVFAPGYHLTQDDRNMVLRQVDDSAQTMIGRIAENRHMPVADIAKLADGSTLNGTQAKRVGLVDEIGGIDEVLAGLGLTEAQKGNVCEMDGFTTPESVGRSN